MELSGLELTEFLTDISRIQKRYLALLLNSIETTIDQESEEFIIIRKYVLDIFNDYTRAIVRLTLAEDIEGLFFR